MEHKWKDRAKIVLETVYDTGYRCNYKTSYPEQCIIEAMCQLAEEVEGNILAKYVNLISSVAESNLFTKEKVEELLQKQRELSADKAKYWRSSVNREYILNAKLKID